MASKKANFKAYIAIKWMNCFLNPLYWERKSVRKEIKKLEAKLK